MATKKTSGSSDEKSSGSSSEKKKVLSLIDDDGKPKKRARKKAAKKAVAKKEVKKEEEGPSETEKQKAAALNLWEKEEKRRSTTKRSKIKEGSATDLPPISLLKEETKDALTLSSVAAKKKEEKPAAKKKKEEAPADAGGAEDGGADAADGGAGGDDDKVIHLKPPIMIEALAERMGLKPFKLIKDLMDLGVFANQKGSVEPDIAAQVCEKHGFEFEREKREKGGGVHKVEEVIEEPPAPDPESEKEDEMKERPPIITFMGHVDHGKTSLLDAIRKTKVVDGEAGGITQHIAAYSVEKDGKSITFLDTPGHAAFSAMRSRGANITDIIVIVVAADDGIMPQTKEAIKHAKKAREDKEGKVAIVVAINKIDTKGADVNRVKQQLQEHDLQTVDWGGEIEAVEVSALKGDGIDTLLETLLLQAELLELRANPKLAARAIVIESRVEPGKGPLASVIVETGTLKVGKPFICGPHSGKVKSMIDDLGAVTKKAGPSMPVELIGFNGIPNVGDEVVEMKNDREAKKLSEERQEELRRKKLERPKRANLKDVLSGIDSASKKKLKLILKTDVQGTAEAIQTSIGEIESDKVNVEFVSAGAGAISENDITLASASDAVVLGFNVKLENKAVGVAKREGIEVKLFSVIYELIDQVRDAMLGLLDLESRETVIGHAEIKAVFKTSKGRVGGALVTDGKVARAARARVLRDGQQVFDGQLDTLRRFQDDVKEVKNGLECGIKLANYNDYKEGDVVECYLLEKVQQTL